MSAALCALHDCVKVDPRPFKNLIPSFTSILKQVGGGGLQGVGGQVECSSSQAHFGSGATLALLTHCITLPSTELCAFRACAHLRQVSEHRLPKTYDYHRFPAPFIQVCGLGVAGLLLRDTASLALMQDNSRPARAPAIEPQAQCGAAPVDPHRPTPSRSALHHKAPLPCSPCPPPFHRPSSLATQIKLLKILAALGAGDRSASENMYAVVAQTLRRANTSHAIGSALIFECVRTITTIYPNPQLLAAGKRASRCWGAGGRSGGLLGCTVLAVLLPFAS